MNQKNHYVSTYKKDYTWPTLPECTESPMEPIDMKNCTCMADSRQLRKEGWRENSLEKYLDFNQIAPMNEILEPRLYTIEIKRLPKADVMPLDQPAICLTEDYPDVRDVKKLPIETISRVDADRMKTTYQTDYCDPAAARLTRRDLMTSQPTPTAIDANSQRLQCTIPIKITVETDCPPYCHLPSLTCDEISAPKYDRKRKDEKCEKKCGEERKHITAWKSEYQDSISKIGHAIIKAKLHQAKKALPVQYQYCTTK